MSKYFKRITSIVLCAALTLSIFHMPASGSDNVTDVPLRMKYSYSSIADEYIGEFKYPLYSEILETYTENSYQSANAQPIILKAPQKVSYGVPKKTGGILGKDDVFVFDDSVEWAEWELTIPADGLYNIAVTYYVLPGTGSSAVRNLYIDGEQPFMEATNIVFSRTWEDIGEPIVNNIGDEVRPKQAEVELWKTVSVESGAGLYPEPFKFYFTKGKHNITLEMVYQDIAISELAIVPAINFPTYAEVKAEYEKAGYRHASGEIHIEAQKNAVKNDPTIRRESNGDPTVSPVSAGYRVLNVIGGNRWRTGGQSISWDFNVEENGLYKIGIRMLQTRDGLVSFRKIEIDGELPFVELGAYKFDYDLNWQNEELRDEYGEPYLFYLTKGVHTLTMTVVTGVYTPIVQSLSSDINLVSNIIRDIYKITGTSPDPNYDYQFFKVIPSLESNLKQLAASMEVKYETIKGMASKVPAMANNFKSIQSQLNAMIKDPFSIARRLKDLENSQTTLSAWYLSLQEQPLTLDYIKMMPAEAVWENEQASFLAKLKITFKNFLTSFTKDYTNVGSVLSDDTEIRETINVWIARGTEWAEIIKEMADEDFTPKTGIAINMNVVTSTSLTAGGTNVLLLSLTSGREPDVALATDSRSPVEFAIRDAIYDLSRFPDYKEVASRFLPGILKPFEYRGGHYAIPETMDFSLMFYRKDILGELGIALPETRKDLYDYVLPALYQNGLEFFYPKDFTHFLFQNGGSFYTEDGIRSTLDTALAYQSFKEYTDLFTQYAVPKDANFYNRFRTGDMPIGIGGYSLYQQLSVAAPELAGRWGVAPIPGTRKADGTIDRSNGTLAQSSDMILASTTKPQESWEFLKWWSSSDTQIQFAREIEALVGAEARWNTANVEAFSSMSWNREHLKVINSQFEWARETPVVLGGYYTNRYVTNAWTSVAVDGGNARDALENAVKEINRELKAKQEEYGYLNE